MAVVTLDKTGGGAGDIKTAASASPFVAFGGREHVAGVSCFGFAAAYGLKMVPYNCSLPLERTTEL